MPTLIVESVTILYRKLKHTARADGQNRIFERCFIKIIDYNKISMLLSNHIILATIMPFRVQVTVGNGL